MATWELQLLFLKNLFWVHTNQGVSLLAIALHGCLAIMKTTQTPPPPFFFSNVRAFKASECWGQVP